MPSTSLGGWFDKVFFDAHGEPCASGELRFYQTGTDIPQGVATFDGTPLGAVIRLDDDGRPESDFRFYTDKIYRVVVVDADGVVVKTIDGVAIPEGEGGGMYNPMTAAGDVIVGGTDGAAERLAAGSEGDALKIVNGVPKWAPDAEGMQNPMTTAGDLIVGTTDGAPDRLGVGNDGDILTSALFVGNVEPKWEAGPKKYRNVYHNIPSPDIDDGYLGCLFYLDDTATLTLPSAANIPSKSFIDFVFLDGTATLTITPQGTTTLNEQATAVTIGGQAATLYRLTFLGHGGSGDEWALGGSGNGDHKVSADGTDTAGYLEDKIGAGSGISLATSAGKVVVSASTQPGDHKTAVDGADASPDYLAAKLAAGSGISLTNTGSAVEIAADAQSGDHQLLVSATDAAAGYLGAKLTAGANVTLTPQTDGDGVQTLEISATGGGGGAADSPLWWQTAYLGGRVSPGSVAAAFNTYVPGFALPSKIRSFSVMTGGISPTQPADTSLWVAIYNYASSVSDRHLLSSFTWDSSMAPPNWSEVPLSFNFDSPITIDKSKSYLVVIYNNKALQWTAGPKQVAVYQNWGSTGWSPTAATMVSPPTNYPYTGWSYQDQFPFIQLNSWSV